MPLTQNTEQFIDSFVDENALRQFNFDKQKLLPLVEAEYKEADKQDIFSIFVALIDHQFRIAVNIRRLIKLNPFFQSVELLENIAKHDSDKLTDDFVIKSYIAQEHLSRLIIFDKERSKKVNALRGVLRLSHGLFQTHHAEHYKQEVKLSKELIIEHVSDVIAIADKNGEFPSDFYQASKAKVFKLFSEYNDKEIENIYNIYNTEIYNQIPTDRKFIEKAKKIIVNEKVYLKYNNWVSPALSEEQIKIFDFALEKNKTLTDEEIELVDRKNNFLSIEVLGKNTEMFKKTFEPIMASCRKSIKKSIVYNKIEDEFDVVDIQLMNLSQNLYYFFEQKWSELKSDKKEEALQLLSPIAKYKLNIFNKNFDLKKELILAIEGNESSEIKLAKVASILDTMRHFQKNYGSASIIYLADRCKNINVSLFVRSKKNNLETVVKNLELRRKKNQIFPFLAAFDEINMKETTLMNF